MSDEDNAPLSVSTRLTIAVLLKQLEIIRLEAENVRLRATLLRLLDPGLHHRKARRIIQKALKAEAALKEVAR